MKIFGRVLFAFSFMLLLFFTLSLTTLAGDTNNQSQIQTDCHTTSLDNIIGEVDITELEKHIEDNVINCVSEIDVSLFNIPYSNENVNAISDYIYNDLIEAFHVKRIGFSYIISENPSLASIIINYKPDCTEEVYSQQLQQCRNAADKILEGIADNPNLTDAEKLLLIHDRLIALTEYDYDNYLNGTTPDESYTIYGLLVKGTAVCQGYSKAFKYLAEKIGIPSDICISRELSHAWNIVYLDGTPYHVDVTFDDPVPDVTGRVFHNNFLLSDEAIKKSNHDANDYFVGATDTRYEDAFWKNSSSQIIYLDNEFYYIDENDKKLVKKSDESVVLDLDYNWSNWVGNYSMLTTDGQYIYYSTPDSIYKYNIKSKTSVVIFTIDTQQNKNQLIYGFTYKNGVFFYDLSTSPNYSTSTLRQLSFIYDDTSDISPDPTLIEIDGILYYYNNAEIDYSETLVFYKNQWYYVNNGRFQDTYTGLVNYYNVWYYVENGILNWSYTGLVYHYGSYYYVENGVLNWSYTGLVYHYGCYYYVENGMLNWNYTGLTNYYDVWYYVENGVLNWNYTGLAYHYGYYYYVENGVLNWSYTGLVYHYGSYYYVENGMLNWNYTGLTLYYNVWYYVENGVLNLNYTGLTLYYNVWYYVENGVLNWNYTGLAYHCGDYYYVENGVLNWVYTGYTNHYGTWYYIENGYLNWSKQ